MLHMYMYIYVYAFGRSKATNAIKKRGNAGTNSSCTTAGHLKGILLRRISCSSCRRWCPKGTARAPKPLNCAPVCEAEQAARHQGAGQPSTSPTRAPCPKSPARALYLNRSRISCMHACMHACMCVRASSRSQVSQACATFS
jgi:hypothetical protein